MHKGKKIITIFVSLFLLLCSVSYSQSVGWTEVFNPIKNQVLSQIPELKSFNSGGQLYATHKMDNNQVKIEIGHAFSDPSFEIQNEDYPKVYKVFSLNTNLNSARVPIKQYNITGKLRIDLGKNGAKEIDFTVSDNWVESTMSPTNHTVIYTYSPEDVKSFSNVNSVVYPKITIVSAKMDLESVPILSIQDFIQKRKAEIVQKQAEVKQPSESSTTSSSSNNSINSSSIQNDGTNMDGKTNGNEERQPESTTENNKDGLAINPNTGKPYTLSEMEALKESSRKQQQEKLDKAVNPGNDLLKNRGVNKERTTDAVTGLGKGISNGTLNIGLRAAAPKDVEYKGMVFPYTIGISFGYFKGTELMLRKKDKRYPFPWGAYTFASMSHSVPEDSYYNGGGVRDGFAETYELGAFVGLGIFKLVEIMPAAGLSWNAISGVPDGSNYLLQENVLGIHLGGMGRFGFVYYGGDYNLTTNHFSFTIGLSLSKKR